MIALLYFFSGATALVYQLVWTRRLVLVVGNTHLSVTTLLFSFMLGLGLGAYWSGRRLARGADARRLYAGAEIALGLFAACVPWAASELESGLASLPGEWGSGIWLRFGLAALILLPACFCMGITFPAACVLAVHDRRRAGRSLAWLNGVNIAGAASGAALTGFVLIPELGLRTTVWCAAVVNLLLGALAWKVLRPTHDPGEPSSASGFSLGGVLVVGLSSGAVIGLEVLWTRMLVFHLKGFTYTFTAILVVFLVGLSLGSVVIAPWLGRWIRGRLAFGLAAFVAAAVSATAIDFLIGGGRHLEDLFRELREAGPPGQLRFLFLSTLWAIGPAVLTLGTLFPLALNAWLPAQGSLGKAGARLYLASSIGSALGACLAGLVLVPSWGMIRGAWAIVVVLALLGVGVMATERRRGGLVLAGVCALAITAWLWPRFDWSPAPYVTGTPVMREARRGQFALLEYREGTACTVSVLEDRATGRRLLYTDEFMAAATGEGYRYMRLMGHLPALLVDAPRRALLIAFGTGTTAGSLIVHEDIEHLDIVEISREVLEVADLFEESNRGVLTGAAPFEVKTHVRDGRQFLLASKASYDLITLEPLLPFTPAAVHFYTREFFELCRRRLAPGGVLCHWIPIHAIEPAAYRTLLATFADVFPEGGVWVFENSSLLVGTAEPLVIRSESFQERAVRPAIAADLAAALAPKPEHVLGGFVTSNAALRAELASVPVMYDDRATVEYGMWWPGRESYDYHAANVSLLLDLSRGAELTFDPSPDEDPASKELAEAAKISRTARLLALREAGHTAAKQGRHAAAKSEDETRLLVEAVALAPDDPWPLHQLEERRFEQLFVQGIARSRVDPRGARSLMARAVDLRPEQATARLWLAKLTRDAGDPDAAVRVLAAGLERFSGWEDWGATRQFLDSHPDIAPLLEAARGLFRGSQAPSLEGTRSWLVAFSSGRAGLEDAPPDSRRFLVDIIADVTALRSDRRAAFEALASLGGAEELERLKTWAARVEGDVQQAAWRAIGRIDAAGLVTILQAVLAGEDVERKNRAVELIGELELRAMVPDLIQELSSPAEADRLLASIVLFQVTGEQLGFDFQGDEAQRLQAIERWKRWWAEQPESADRNDDRKDGEHEGGDR